MDSYRAPGISVFSFVLISLLLAPVALFGQTSYGVWTVGMGTDGALGNGSSSDTASLVQMVAAGVRAVGAGGSNTYYVTTTNELWGAGNNGGQLADGTSTRRYSPVRISDGVSKLAAGNGHVLFIRTDGSVWACGSNRFGQLGDGSTADRYSAVRINLPNVVDVYAGGYSSFFITSDGALWAAGLNNYGQLGDGTYGNRMIPVKVVAGDVVAAGTHEFHSLFLKRDGSLWGMGRNAYGELLDKAGPNPGQLVASGVQSLAVGLSHSLFVKADGSLHAMGFNGHGQLGDGTTTNRSEARQVVASGVRQAAAGYDFSVFLKADGSVWAMGANQKGQLGDGTGYARLSPTRVDSGSGVAIAAGYWHSVIGAAGRDAALIPIPAGSVSIGSPDYPARSIQVGEVFASPYEVSFGSWSYFRSRALALGYKFYSIGQRGGWGPGDAASLAIKPTDAFPVTSITGLDMLAWLNARSELDGMVPCYHIYDSAALRGLGEVYKGQGAPASLPAFSIILNPDASGYRLPSGSEWEKAARGGLPDRRYPWGDSNPVGTAFANWYVAAGQPNDTTAGGSYPANAYGLYDVAGNVYELTWDDSAAPPAAGATNPFLATPVNASSTVLWGRGGAWNAGYDPRVAFRQFGINLSYSGVQFGFRIFRNGSRTSEASAPTIVTAPVSSTVIPGGNAVFSVLAAGSSPLGYQWSKGGTSIPGATTATYLISPAQPGNAGSYSVTITNPWGSVTSNPVTLTVASGLVAQWKLEGNANDSVGASNGVAQNVQWVSQKVGDVSRTVAFLGGASSVAGISVPKTPSLDLPITGYTISGWVMSPNFTAAPPANGYFTLVASQGIGGQQEDAYVLRYSAHGLNFQVSSLDNYPNPDPNYRDIKFFRTSASDANVMTSGRWYLVAVTYDGSAFRGYVDGEELTQTAGSAAAVSAPPKSTGRSTGIGMRNNASTGTYNPPNNGYISDVRIYNRALSLAEISALASYAPQISAQPVGLSVGVGASASFSVAGYGSPAPSYQWFKAGVAIAGATASTYSVAIASPESAGNYHVELTNSVGKVQSNLVNLNVVQVPVNSTASVTQSSRGYVAGGVATIEVSIAYSGALSALGYQAVIPSGWGYAGGSNEGGIKPANGTTGSLGWAWTSVPASPVTFTYALNVPATASGTQLVTGTANVRFVGGSSATDVAAAPNPLALQSVVGPAYHSADSNRDRSIGLSELTRLIELYNWREGSVRTGQYSERTGTEDGYAPGPGALANFHSADTNRDGSISLSELTRVIELYNFRAGSSRTGQYHPVPGTEDGFAPGP